MKIKIMFDFDFDLCIHFPAAREILPVPAADRLPLGVPLLSVDDYPANKKAVDCVICKTRLKVGQGYKRYFWAGFLCEYCQRDENLPTRS